MIFWPNVIAKDKASGVLYNVMTSNGFEKKSEAEQVINRWGRRNDLELVSSWIDVIEGVHNIGCIDHVCYIQYRIDDVECCADDVCDIH